MVSVKSTRISYDCTKAPCRKNIPRFPYRTCFAFGTHQNQPVPNSPVVGHHEYNGFVSVDLDPPEFVSSSHNG